MSTLQEAGEAVSLPHSTAAAVAEVVAVAMVLHTAAAVVVARTAHTDTAAAVGQAEEDKATPHHTLAVADSEAEAEDTTLDEQVELSTQIAEVGLEALKVHSARMQIQGTRTDQIEEQAMSSLSSNIAVAMAEEAGGSMVAVEGQSIAKDWEGDTPRA